MSLLLTLNIFPPFSSVSIVNFEHVIAGWVTAGCSLLIPPENIRKTKGGQHRAVMDYDYCESDIISVINLV